MPITISMNTSNYIKDNLSFGTTLSSDIVDRLPLGGDFFIMNKKCLQCLKEKDLELFSIDSMGKLKRKSRCKDCINESNRNRSLSKYEKLKIIDINGEIWKDIVGYEGIYMVSNFGRVKSLYRQQKNKSSLFTTFEKLRKLYINEYYVFNTGVTGSTKTIRVHRAIAQCFIPNPENKPCVNHIDGNKLNNSIENLEWVTFKENTVHGVQNGLIKVYGENSHWAKLVESQVIDIYTSKESTRELAGRYGVNDETIRKIKIGVNWKRITKNIK